MSRRIGLSRRFDRPDQLLAGLTSEQSKAILKHGRPIKLGRGDVLFRQDDRATTFFQLVSGRMRLCQATAGGNQVLLRLIGNGHVFGLRSLNGGGPYHFSAQAIRPSEAIAWKSDFISGLLEDIPQLVSNLFSVMLDRADEYQVRLRDLITLPIEKRLARTVLQLADEFGQRSGNATVIDGGFTLKDLAEITGTTLFTASRVTSNWERTRIVKKERGALTLRNLPRLQAIAE
ncbi:MAG TPA: Crp/Fnr family transcriptional regulator [Candidatus Dormibacteraeota bacterium]|nr:Crp/Fnr family transcriptional regulator [Candidatus Dormibacteraeota bacterium]